MRGYIGPKAKIAIVTNPRIYLDHAATTPLRPEARAAMEQGFALWANHSSPHAEGRKARAALEDARERVKAALEWEGELIFTSGASEAAALALDAVNAVHDIASAVEHDAVLRGDRLEWTLPVRHDGAADLLALSTESRPSELLVDDPENRSLVPWQADHYVTGISWQRPDGWRASMTSRITVSRSIPCAFIWSGICAAISGVSTLASTRCSPTKIAGGNNAAHGSAKVISPPTPSSSAAAIGPR